MSDTVTPASAVIVGRASSATASPATWRSWAGATLCWWTRDPSQPGGPTGRPSNFIFPVECSKMMMELTRDSTEQHQELGVFTQSGGLEVARTAERMHELHCRCSAAMADALDRLRAAALPPGASADLVAKARAEL